MQLTLFGSGWHFHIAQEFAINTFMYVNPNGTTSIILQFASEKLDTSTSVWLRLHQFLQDLQQLSASNNWFFKIPEFLNIAKVFLEELTLLTNVIPKYNIRTIKLWEKKIYLRDSLIRRFISEQRWDDSSLRRIMRCPSKVTLIFFLHISCSYEHVSVYK